MAQLVLVPEFESVDHKQQGKLWSFRVDDNQLTSLDVSLSLISGAHLRLSETFDITDWIPEKGILIENR